MLLQSHSWLFIIFTLTIVANFVVRTQGRARAWVTYTPLPPLHLMLFSGLYMVVKTTYIGRRSAEAKPMRSRSSIDLPHSSSCLRLHIRRACGELKFATHKRVLAVSNLSQPQT